MIDIARRMLGGHTAPFIVAYSTIVVLVDVGEEAVETGIGDSNAGAHEGGGELILVEVAIVVAIDGLEEAPELFLRLCAEPAEF